MSELGSLLIGANLAIAGAVAMVLVFRLPVRRLFGAQATYALWLAVPLAALALLIPARTITAPRPVLEPGPFEAGPVFSAGADALQGPAGPSLSEVGLLIWLLGAAASLGVLAWRQRRFVEAAREGMAGPAVVGVIRPRIVAPDDFVDRYTPPEQAVVMAHERTHIARHDSRINAAVAAARCVCWFNPMVHLGAYVLRIDQELSCDARVVAEHPKSRRAYAEAMLKTQLAARPLPLGCYWPAQSKHPLAERIRLLAQPRPGPVQRFAGMAFVVAATLFAGVSAWAAKPPQMVPEALVRVVARTPIVAPPPAPATAPARPAEQPRAQPSPVAAEVQVAAAPVEITAPVAEPTPPPVPTPETPAPATGLKRFVLLPRAPDTVLESPGNYPTPTMAVDALTAQWPVEPGSAVQVVTTVDTPDGKQIVSNMTTFGSQDQYRSGTYSTHGSRFGLRTRVRQRGDRAEVYVRMIQGEAENRVLGSGMAVLRSGETDSIVLSNGQSVTLSLLVRPETDYERKRGQAVMARMGLNGKRLAANAARLNASAARMNAARCRTDPSGC